MARIRTIKPDFWKHEDLSALPEATHMLAGALLNYADDQGFFNANPKLIAAELMPLREPSVSIQVSLCSLSKVGYLHLGTGSDGKRYGRIVNFAKHQYINRPTPSKISELTIVWDVIEADHGAISEDAVLERKGRDIGKEGKGKDISSARKLAVNLNGHAEQFEEFYRVYPIHKGRGAAKRAYLSALKRASPDQLLDGAKRYAEQTAQRAGDERRFIKHPATWLNADGWADEPDGLPFDPQRVLAEMAARGEL